MAEGIPARLTAAEGRNFGVTLGLAFLTLGAIALWRGKHMLGPVLLALGGVLLTAGLVVPTMLGPVERAWMGLGHLMSRVTQPVFMAVVYFVVISPFGFARRRLGSPMQPSPERLASRWEPHVPAVDGVARMERQF